MGRAVKSGPELIPIFKVTALKIIINYIGPILPLARDTYKTGKKNNKVFQNLI